MLPRVWLGGRGAVQTKPSHCCSAGLYCPYSGQALIHFASRRAMDIEGLGEKLVEQLVDSDFYARLPIFIALDLPTLPASNACVIAAHGKNRNRLCLRMR